MSDVKWTSTEWRTASGEWRILLATRHLPLATRCCELFIAQRLDRIFSRGLAGRVIAKDDSRRHANTEGQQHRDGRYDGASFRVGRDGLRHRIPERKTHEAAGHGKNHGLAQELRGDRSRSRSDRAANADLVRSFKHACQHDIHNADAAD